MEINSNSQEPGVPHNEPDESVQGKKKKADSEVNKNALWDDYTEIWSTVDIVYSQGNLIHDNTLFKWSEMTSK